MSWLIENWKLKLLALVLSLGLFAAVAFQQNPIQTPYVGATVKYNGLPEAFVLVGAPTKLQVQVVGLAADLHAMAPTSVFVDVDVSKLKKGEQVLYGKPRVVADRVSPQLDTIPFNVTVDDRITVQVPVETRVSFAPGWQPVPDKTRVTDPAKPLAITGPARDLIGLRAYVTLPTPVTGSSDVPSLPINFERLGQNVTLPRDTIPVVTVGGGRVAVLHVESIKITQKIKVPVIETPTGNPAPGYRVTAITLDPLFIEVTGSADDLASLNSVTLAPISIEGFNATTTRQLRVVNLPANVTSAVATVAVTISITQNPAVQPSPSPRPSP